MPNLNFNRITSTQLTDGTVTFAVGGLYFITDTHEFKLCTAVSNNTPTFEVYGVGTEATTTKSGLLSPTEKTTLNNIGDLDSKYQDSSERLIVCIYGYNFSSYAEQTLINFISTFASGKSIYIDKHGYERHMIIDYYNGNSSNNLVITLPSTSSTSSTFRYITEGEQILTIKKGQVAEINTLCHKFTYNGTAYTYVYITSVVHTVA